MSRSPQSPRLRPVARSLPRRVAVLAGMLLVAGAGCGDTAPALQVGGVAYTEEDLLGLTPTRRETLRDLAALAVVVEQDRVDALGAPLLHRQETDRLWQQLQVEQVLAEQQVADEVLRARYSANPAHELTVRHLIILSPRYEGDATRAEARAKAERALERIRGGEPFPEVAAEVSEEPGAEGRQGLLEPGRRGAWVDEFWNAADALEVGEVSPVVETQYGFHVLRLEGREDVPFDEVRGRVAREVAEMIAPLDPDAGSAPVPDGFEPVGELNALVDDGAPVGSFDGMTLTLGDLLDLAATLDPATWAAAREGTGDVRDRLLDRAARRAGVRARAREAGVVVDPLWQAGAREDWRERIQQWAGVFGFRAGMGTEATRAAALEALRATGQIQGITRDQVSEIRGLLRRHFAAGGS